MRDTPKSSIILLGFVHVFDHMIFSRRPARKPMATSRLGSTMTQPLGAGASAGRLGRVDQLRGEPRGQLHWLAAVDLKPRAPKRWQLTTVRKTAGNCFKRTVFTRIEQLWLGSWWVLHHLSNTNPDSAGFEQQKIRNLQCWSNKSWDLTWFKPKEIRFSHDFI